ncbi:hypothetical protein L6R52_33305, partial [Myxococcota bacterium]|nr:hypothetical protein [Myxococcota bacterium]
ALREPGSEPLVRVADVGPPEGPRVREPSADAAERARVPVERVDVAERARAPVERVDAPERAEGEPRGPVSLAASLLAVAWQRPTVPQLGVAITSALAVEPWSFELRVEGAGQLCCALSTAEVADGRASSWTVMAGVARDVGAIGPFVVAAHLSAGVAVASIEGRVAPDVFSGPSPIQTEEGVEGRARAAVVARWPVGALAPFLGLGADLRTPRLTLRLPEPYAGGRTSFDPGPWMPHVEAGVIFTP